MVRGSLHQLVRRGVLLLTVLVVLLAVAAGAMVLVTRSFNDRASDARETLLRLQDLRAAVLDAETGLRGFALVERPGFLAPYRSGLANARVEADWLRPRIDPDARDELREAEALFEDWRRDFAEPILGFLRAGRPAAAQRVLDSGQGKRRIDSIRLLLDGVEEEEREAVSAAQRDVDRVQLLLLMTVLVLAGVLLLIGTGLLRRLRRSVVDPIDELAVAAGKIHAGDLRARVAPRGAVEVASVGQAFNEMAQQVERVVEGLRELDESKSQFISTVSHELRTPLTSIVGYLELAMEEMPGEDPSDEGYRQRQEFLRVAERNTRRLQRLVNDLLFVAQADAGKVKLQRSRADLTTLAAESVEAAQPHAGAGGVALALDVNGPVEAEVDAGRIAQVLDNLVSNGIKFTPVGGSVTVAVADAGAHARIAVRDTGMGISQQDQRSLFERFFRTAAAGEAAIQGAGLGLTIVRSIVEAHGGTISVESSEGAGTAFRIELPKEAP